MVQIVAVSHCRSKTVVAYEIVSGPPLPFSLGSSGALVASGKTLIGGVESSAVLADGLDVESEVIESGVLSNGGDSPRSVDGQAVSASLTLASGVKVVGDAQAVGSIALNGGVVERGTTKPFSEREQLPDIDIASYDPGDKATSHMDAVVADSKPIYGFQRYGPPGVEGDGYSVTFTGDVDLQGTLLFVNGDVVLDKPLKGTGALVATGKVTLKGGANMKADSLAAVLAGKDLTISGTAGVPSNFTGLLYTEGNLALSNTRTVGAAIAAGTGEGGSTMSIVDSEVLSSPEGTDVAIAIQNFASPDRIGRDRLSAAEPTKLPSKNEVSVLAPLAKDLIVNGDVQTDESFIRSATKLVFRGIPYDKPSDLPADAPTSAPNTYERTIKLLLKFADDLEKQNAQKPIEILRFDLNEFLNVSDRLRSSRTFYIEG